jgi:uncharacterized protein (TIGR03437 family)
MKITTQKSSDPQPILNNFGQVGLYINGGPMLFTPTTPNGMSGPYTANAQLQGMRAMNGYGQIITSSMLFTPLTPNGAVGTLTAVTGLAGATQHTLLAINEKGVVLGYSCVTQVSGGCRNHGFIWTPKTPNAVSGTTIELPIPPGFTAVTPTAINGTGMITGTMDTATGSTLPFLYLAGTYYDLTTLNSVRAQAIPVAINQAGQIVFNSDSSVYLATPATPPTPPPGGTVAVTITANTAGLVFTTGGTGCAPDAYTAPQTLQWTPGASCTVTFVVPQGPDAGTRSLLTGWQDGSTANPRVIVAPGQSTTFTANFTTQYLLTKAVNPGSGGSIVASPVSGDGYYSSGASVQLTANPASGFTMAFFSGDLAGSANPQIVLMTAPRSVTANFSGATGANVPPYAVELAPFQGAGATQTFAGTFTDANGWTDIAKATFLFHESYAGTSGTCTVEMRPQTGQITVIDDAGVSYAAPVALGSASQVQNSACIVDAANSSFSGSGNVLTANVALTFKPAFGSAGGREPRKAICQWAKDSAGAGEPQSCFGLWIPEAPAPSQIPRFRLYNPINYAHFFTASQNENNVLVGRGFSPEPSPGVVFDQPTSVNGVPTRAYYRILFFPTNGAPIFHYWTRDRDEYKAAVRSRGLNLGEGIDSFMLTSQVPNTFPLSRLLFTAGPSPYPIYHYALEYETSVLLGMGWGRSLGVEGYLYPPRAPAAVKAPTARAEKRISAVLNAASHDAGPVAPGQLVRVYGNNFSKLARAFIDGSAAPLTAVTERYIELVVPETVKESVALFVDDLGVRTEAVTLTVAAARPAVFVKDFLGRGFVETLPAEAGTVTLQVTGAGELELGQPKLPISVRLNGYPADIISISTITDQPGRLAVNVKLPAEVLAGDTDVATLTLQAGEAYAQPGLLVRRY